MENSYQKKKSNEHFSLFEAEISLDKIIKSINSKTNNKPPGNDGLTAEFYKHFSNGLAPVLLGCLWLLGKAWHHGCYLLLIEQESYLPYIRGDKKDIENYRRISLLDLDYKIYTTNS